MGSRTLPLDLFTFAEAFDSFFDELGQLFLGGYASGRVPFDIAAQERWLEFLGRRFPGIPVVSEEKPEVWPPKADEFWLLDPLDGTWNYLFGLPLFGTMLSLVRNGRVVFTAVYLPVERALGRGGMYFASQSQGALLRYPDHPSRRLSVSVVGELREAFVILGGLEKEVIRSEPMQRVALAAKEHRRGLSTSWTLTRMVSGALGALSADVALNINCIPWDIMHGCLLLEAAGGKATDFSGRPVSLENCGQVAFSNGLLHDQVIEVLRG